MPSIRCPHCNVTLQVDESDMGKTRRCPECGDPVTAIAEVDTAAPVGVSHLPILDTPIAVLDFETTGLTPGADRVVEVSVVRVEPGGEPQLAFDTLVNPMRRVSATEIHGITDADVANAPRFEDIAGDLVDALSGCVVAAYNVYFDLKFLDYELRLAGVSHTPPHFCLMYMRPMLGLGSRCKLEEACRTHNIDHEVAHVAADDAQASARLLRFYLDVIREKGVDTFNDLARLKSYKFNKSFENSPLPGASQLNLHCGGRAKSRFLTAEPVTIDPERHAIGEYWDALTTALADLDITDEEVSQIIHLRKRDRLPKERIRVLHARAFESALSQFVDDEWLDDNEVRKLRRLHRCLSKLGWAPGD